MDRHTPEQRHRNMAAVKGKNTKPEITVRKLLHKLGYRFRLHRKDLPGRPDIVLPKYKTVIFIHGCFWHRHPNCKYASTPSTNTVFWEKKLEENVRRDREDVDKLEKLGWRVITIWSCELKNRDIYNKLRLSLLS